MKCAGTKKYRIIFLSVALLSGFNFFVSSCSNESEPAPFAGSVQPSGHTLGIIQDSFEGHDYVVYGNTTAKLMTAFSRYTIDSTYLDFELVEGQYPIILRDNEGNTWSILGKAVSGPRTGESLIPMNATMGYYFSFAAFFPKVMLYGEGPEETVPQPSSDQDWLVDPTMVFMGAVKDGIPSLSSPSFIEYNTNKHPDTYIDEEELVIVYFDGEDIRVYPHKILDWHEVINENSGLGSTVVSYCPLTGTSCVWTRKIKDHTLSFGVSGLVYNSNLILYDRETDSNWSQILQKSVNGPFIKTRPELIYSVEMTWESATRLGPKLKVLSDDTGFARNYDNYPYGYYRTDHAQIIYPLTYKDERVPAKERVLAVIVNGKVKIYRFSTIRNQGQSISNLDS